MAYKTPHAHVDAGHFLQIMLLKLFSRGLLLVKLYPIHLKELLTYGKILCAQKVQGKSGSI